MFLHIHRPINQLSHNTNSSFLINLALHFNQLGQILSITEFSNDIGVIGGSIDIEQLEDILLVPEFFQTSDLLVEEILMKLV